MKPTLFLSLCTFSLSGVNMAQDDCPLGAFSRYTDDLILNASSASGAVGDVVPVEVALTVEALHGRLTGATVIAAYDPEILQMVAEPRISDIVETFTYQFDFFRLSADHAATRTGATGFLLNFGFLDEATAVFAEGLPVPLGYTLLPREGKAGRHRGDSFHRLRLCHPW